MSNIIEKSLYAVDHLAEKIIWSDFLDEYIVAGSDIKRIQVQFDLDIRKCVLHIRQLLVPNENNTILSDYKYKQIHFTWNPAEGKWQTKRSEQYQNWPTYKYVLIS